MANKQKRLIVVVTSRPKWHYKLFARRFSKGFDVVVHNGTEKALKRILDLSRPAYEYIALLSDKKICDQHHQANLEMEIDSSALKKRTYQELWAIITYSELKELGHEDGQGYVSA